MTANGMELFHPLLLARLTKLTKLDMEDNELTGTIPTSIGLLAKLTNVFENAKESF
jgi:hypothetical protein